MYAARQALTACATSNPCYSFVNWTEGTNVVSTTNCYTFRRDRLTEPGGQLRAASALTSITPAPRRRWGERSVAAARGLRSRTSRCAPRPVLAPAFVNWTEGANVVSTTSCYSFTAHEQPDPGGQLCARGPLTFLTNTYPNVYAYPVLGCGGGCQRRWEAGFDHRELRGQHADGADQQWQRRLWLQCHAERGQSSRCASWRRMSTATASWI